jgi:hypothetical protein
MPVLAPTFLPSLEPCFSKPFFCFESHSFPFFFALPWRELIAMHEMHELWTAMSNFEHQGVWGGVCLYDRLAFRVHRPRSILLFLLHRC